MVGKARPLFHGSSSGPDTRRGRLTREDIRAHSGIHGRPCDPVPSGCLKPDYGMLEGPRLEYYYRWRDLLGEGILELDDSGYMWLYLCEQINSDDDPLDILGRMASATTAGGRRRTMDEGRLCTIYAFQHGLPPYGFLVNDYASLYDATVTRGLTSYPIRIDGLPWFAAEEYLDQDIHMGRGTYTEVVVRVLRAMDERSRSSEGRGLLLHLGCEADPVVLDPPEEYDWDPMPERILVPAMIDHGPLAFICEGMAKTVSSCIRGKKRRLPRGYPKEFADAAESAYRSVVEGREWDVSEFRVPGHDGFWNDYELPVYEHEIPSRDTGIVRDAGVDGNGDIPDVSQDSIDVHEGSALDDPLPYVPSGSPHPTYASMGRESVRYYISWRTRVRRGEYPETDRGYIWLYCCETAVSHRDPAELLAEVVSLIRGYPRCHELRELASDLAVLHGLPPDGSFYRTSEMGVYLDTCLRADPILPIPMDMAADISGWDPDDYIGRSYRPQWHEGAFNAGLGAVDRCMREDGTCLAEGLELQREKTHRLFIGLPERMRVTVIRPFYYPGFDLYESIEEILRATVARLNERYHNDAPKVGGYVWRGYREEICEAVDRYLDRMEAERAEARRMADMERLSLDADRVQSAERDLEAVTGMMAVDDEGPAGEVNAPDAPVPKGWDKFAASLDDSELAFLADALTPKGAKASYSGRRRGELEESVNSKAMDAVGDAVAEDGRAIDDYRENIEQALTRHA